jgi:hypothetical protein
MKEMYASSEAMDSGLSFGMFYSLQHTALKAGKNLPDLFCTAQISQGVVDSFIGGGSVRLIF